MKDVVEDIFTHERPRRLAEARAIRERLAQGGRLSHSDAVRMAENLHSILSALCAEASVTRRAVVQQANMADPDGKSRPLYAYTLPPGLAGDQAARRQARIVVRPEKYLRLISAAAAITGRDEAGLIIRLVDGTSIRRGIADPAVGADAGHLDLVVQALHGETRLVVSETRLDRYFIEASLHHPLAATLPWPLDGSRSGGLPPPPIVWLWTEELGTVIGSYEADDSRAAPTAASALICRRVGLAIMPLGRDMDPVPSLCRQPGIVLVERHVSVSRPTGGSPGSRQLAFLPGILPAGKVTLVPGGRFIAPGTAATGRRMHGLAHRAGEGFLPVTSGSLAMACASPHPVVGGVAGDMLEAVGSGYTRSHSGSRMALLEAALVHGCGQRPSDMARLGYRLREAAVQAANDLRDWLTDGDAAVDEALSRMSARRA